MNLSTQGYVDNIEKETLENENFRKVLYTGPNMQLVLMTLKPNEDIGSEVHADHDQFLRIESGTAKVVLNGEETIAENDFAIVVPAGTEHNIINTSDTEVLKLYTLYAPPEHPENTVQLNKPE